MTCYDLRFPESARRAVDAGADVLLCPAAWAAGPGKIEQWTVLAQARAIESTAFVVAVGMAGRGVCGSSTAVGPDGTVRARLGLEPGQVTVDLDHADVVRTRERNPSLANRRFAVGPRVGAGGGAQLSTLRGGRAGQSVLSATTTAAKWHQNPTTVPAWNSSWNPNQRGTGLGRLVAYMTAPTV